MTDSQYRLKPGASVHGTIQVPGDKSISHRAVILAALAEGVSTVSGFLEGEDCLATLAAFKHMGVQIETTAPAKVTIHGVGLQGLQAPSQALDFANSGTAMRLMAGVLAAQPFASQLTGDASLLKRPMGRIVEPLRLMGAKIEMQQDGRPPLSIQGGQTLHGIEYEMPVASAQLKSCLLLAGLYAQGTTLISEPGVTRNHTENLLQACGYPVTVDGSKVAIVGGASSLQPLQIEVPGDISSAAFFIVAATITADSEVVLTNVGINASRIGIINVLTLMGAKIQIENSRRVGDEPVADLRVRSAQLHGIDIPSDQVPLAIDEFPAIFIAAACASGVTSLHGAKELRVKESDRIQVMAEGLNKLGIETQVVEDGITIYGGRLTAGTVDSHGDHRIAMAFAVAGLVAGGEIIVNDCANVATSFPNFVELANTVGWEIKQ